MDGPESSPGFGAALRRRRTAALLTQEQLADRAGLSVRTIRDLERGRVRYPRPGSLRLLAEVLGLTGSDLTEFEALGRRRYWAERVDAEQPPARAVPAQLPGDVAGFTGRSDVLAALDAALDAPSSRIAVLAGAPGVGKTALAVHWAHRVRARFPDGQLYVNLLGYAGRPPMTAMEALARLLRGLDVPPDRVPTDLGEATALFRSLLADSRTLLVLDDALRVDQVRPLLPGGAGCAVLVTSRESLLGLVAREGAVAVSVQALAPDDSAALLAALLGAERVAAEPAAAAELAVLCGHLPLALRIAAANILGSDTSLAAYTRRLRSGNRLAELAVPADSDAMVRGAFDLSYAALSPAAQRLFRLLSIAPGRDIGLPAAAVLLGASTRECTAVLAQLTRANLVESPVQGRFAQPDLLRLYAAEQLTAADDRTGAWERLMGHYLARLDAAAARLYPTMLRLPGRGARTGAPFPDAPSALAWVDAELPALQEAVRTSAADGPRRAAWMLGDALRGYLQLRRAALPWRAVAEAALAAATAEGDAAALVTGHLSRAGVHALQDAYPQAIEHAEQALASAMTARWAEGERAALRFLGDLYRVTGRADEAIAHFERVLAMPGTTDADRLPVVERMAAVHHERGGLAAAADGYAQVLALQDGSPVQSAMVHADLGDVLGGLGRTAEALAHLEEALRLRHELGDRAEEAYVLRGMAEVHRDAGRLAEAAELATTAVALAAETDDARLGAQATETLATVRLAAGAVEEAVGLFDTAVREAERTGNHYTRAQALAGRAAAALALGEPTEAAAAARTATELARRNGYRLLEGQALTVWARAQTRLGHDASAVELAGAAVAAQETTGWVRGLADARAALVSARAGQEQPVSRISAETRGDACSPSSLAHCRPSS